MNEEQIKEFVEATRQYMDSLKRFEYLIGYTLDVRNEIQNQIVNFIVLNHLPVTMFHKVADAKGYVVDLITLDLYNELEMTDTQWFTLLNKYILQSQQYPYKIWYWCQKYILRRCLDADRSNI